MPTREKFLSLLSSAKYDLATAEVMQASVRWLEMCVACREALEKQIMGLYDLYLEVDPPDKSAASGLFEALRSKLPQPIDAERESVLLELLSLHLDVSDAEEEASSMSCMDEKEALQVLDQTKEIFAWLLTLAP